MQMLFFEFKSMSSDPLMLIIHSPTKVPSHDTGISTEVEAHALQSATTKTKSVRTAFSLAFEGLTRQTAN